MSETKHSRDETKGASANSSGASAQSRLIALAIASLLALTTVVWIKARIWERLARLEHSFATIESETFLLGLHVRETVGRLNGMLLRFQLSGDASERDNFRQTAQDLSERLRTSQPRLSTPRERQLAGKIETGYEQYLTATAALRDRAVRGVRKDSVAQVQEQIDEHSRDLLRLANDLAAAQRVAMATFFSQCRGALNSLQILLWCAVVFLLALVGFVAALGYKALVAPLRRQLSASQSLIERHEKLASLGALAAGVAHEIRNPLTAIKFRLFSLKKTLPLDLRDHEDLATIDGEVHRLERIVRDFLQFARPSQPALEDVPVPELIEQLQRLLKHDLARRGVDLQVAECPAIMVRADRQQLQQVLINLVQNGAESLNGAGAITLSVRQGAARLAGKMAPVVMLDVADTGAGIPSEAQKRLFDPFFSTKENGTGLGLPIASRIVEQHGGHIQYTTQAGQGTTFTVVLPARAHDESTHSTDRR